jgi:3D (Asp-Asp-Asp) domain-containing protein
LAIKTPLVGQAQPLGERAPATTGVLTGAVTAGGVVVEVLPEVAPTGRVMTVVLIEPDGEFVVFDVLGAITTGAVATAVEFELERPSKRIAWPT